MDPAPDAGPPPVEDSPAPEPGADDADVLDDLAREACQLLMQLEAARPLDTSAWTHRWQAADGSATAVRPWGMRSERCAFGRVVRVDGGSRVQVLNIVLFPTLESGLPVLGVEILTFRRGLHLFVLDACPLWPDRFDHDGWVEALDRGREAFPPACLREVPAWGQHVFSPSLVLAKPHPREPVPMSACLAPCRALLHHWLARATGLPACAPGEGPVDVLARRARYLKHHADDEPAGPFLRRTAGDAWAESFIYGFLFPSALREGDTSPAALDWYQRVIPA
jgi:15,16-dihydrobiliverdin:ferredoxin oxidoreductase